MIKTMISYAVACDRCGRRHQEPRHWNTLELLKMAQRDGWDINFFDTSFTVYCPDCRTLAKTKLEAANG